MLNFSNSFVIKCLGNLGHFSSRLLRAFHVPPPPPATHTCGNPKIITVSNVSHTFWAMETVWWASLPPSTPWVILWEAHPVV